ncbi:MAG: glycolate oxidase subunit GlcE, partial [Pseudomonadota bacterium]
MIEEAELAEEIRAARRDRTPVRIIGGGTRLALGRPVQPSRVLSMSDHSGITTYDPGALTLIARAGTPMAEIETALDAENQILAFEPMDHRALLGSSGEPTIGGVVAANVSGPRRVAAGACRDFVLGARFITGEGEIVKNGGRVMKNVTGLDLAKFMCGAYGTLGVLTEVALKVLPKPAAAITLSFDEVDAGQGASLLRRALGTPFEVTGAAYDGGRALLRIEGLESQVADRAERLAQTLGGAPNRIEGEAHEALWRGIRDVEAFAGREGAVWRLSIKPTDAPLVAEALSQAVGAETRFDWGGGLIWALTARDDADSAAAVREALSPFGGYATLVRGPAALRASAFQPESKRIALISEQLRRKFDPDGVLNPGLMAA